jgi:lipopolysaccharide/colanic/teichoic acid biosynthesis glycosyltransferase
MGVEEISEGRASVRPTPLASSAYLTIKRTIDIIGAAIMLVALSPVFLVIAIAIVIDGGLPIIYRCQRLGLTGRPIEVLKFRTMHNGSHHHLEELLTADEERRLEYRVNRKLRHDPRRTRFGTFLRRYSLDELPQLWNVLIGEMSSIGPRPYMPDELRGRPEAITLLSVRPGITGLWQVNGRSDRTFEERVALEVNYVRRGGFRLDALIVLRTFGAVLSGKGAY